MTQFSALMNKKKKKKLDIDNREMKKDTFRVKSAGTNTLIIDKRTPAISADPEEHFEDHSSDQHGS